jgi:hypothetical protein
MWDVHIHGLRGRPAAVEIDGRPVDFVVSGETVMLEAPPFDTLRVIRAGRAGTSPPENK